MSENERTTDGNESAADKLMLKLLFKWCFNEFFGTHKISFLSQTGKPAFINAITLFRENPGAGIFYPDFPGQIYLMITAVYLRERS